MNLEETEVQMRLSSMVESQMKEIVEAKKYKFIIVGKGDQKVLIFEVPDVGENTTKKYLSLSKRNGFKFMEFQAPSADGVIPDGAETFWSHAEKHRDDLEKGLNTGLQQDKDMSSIVFHTFGFPVELSQVGIEDIKRLRDLNTMSSEEISASEEVASDAMVLLGQTKGIF